MSTKATLIADRATAGAAYAAALTSLRSAYVELAAYDAALANRNVAPEIGIRSFSGAVHVDGIPWSLRHPEFAPTDGGGVDLAVATRRDQLISGFTST